MKTHRSAVLEKIANRKGQSLAEYALILSLIALVCVTAVALMGGTASGFFTDLGGQF